jgi:cytidine deaminase
MTYRTLVKRARAAQRKSFSPYSRFRVGAALLTADGKVFTGCNIESSSYGLTVCAERTAIFKAVSEGKKRFRAIAVVSDDDGFTPPCGACRQVLMDLAGDIDFIMANGDDELSVLKLSTLFPHPFGSEYLLKPPHDRSHHS